MSAISQTHECPICILKVDYQKANSLEAAVQLSCGHVFGRSCLINWAGQSKTCPTCRAGFTEYTTIADGAQHNPDDLEDRVLSMTPERASAINQDRARTVAEEINQLSERQLAGELQERLGAVPDGQGLNWELMRLQFELLKLQ